jgi:hypothetical protein
MADEFHTRWLYTLPVLIITNLDHGCGCGSDPDKSRSNFDYVSCSTRSVSTPNSGLLFHKSKGNGELECLIFRTIFFIHLGPYFKVPYLVNASQTNAIHCRHT